MTAKTIKGWYRVHKYTSLVCTAFLLILCVTGLPLIFADEIDNLVPDHHVPADSTHYAAKPASLQQMVAVAERRYPGEYLLSLSWDDDNGISHTRVRIRLTADRTPPQRVHSMMFDAHTGRLLEEDFPWKETPNPLDRIFDAVYDMHTQLFLGFGGEMLLCAMGLLFVAATVSGVLVYGPFMRRLRFGTLRHDRGPRTAWFDLHNLLGIVTVAWLLVVGATGVMNTLALPLFAEWTAQTMPAMLAPYRGQPPPTSFASLDTVIAATHHAVPGMTLTGVTFPTNPNFASNRHFLIWAHGGSTLMSRLFTPVLVDARTGVVVSARGLPWYLRLLEVSRPFHFGDYGGLPLKLLWTLFDLATIAVLGSGVYLWLSRRKGPFEARLDELEREEAAILTAGAA